MTYSCAKCGGTSGSQVDCCGQQMGTYAAVSAAAAAASNPAVNALVQAAVMHNPRGGRR